MAFSVGIDLGTTNTVVSIGRRGMNDNIEVTTEAIDQISEDGFSMKSSTLLPSVLYIDNGEHNVGLVAKAMKGQSVNRVIFNSKNRIGDSECKWKIDNKEYTPEIVASYFLSAIRKQLKSKYNDEDSVNSAIITVPASFNIDQRNATKRAAQLAGFNEDITLISEPTAAILDLINEQSKVIDEDKVCDFSNFKNVLVFDLGGGTCDIAILKVKIKGKDVYVEEKAVSPHTLIGGTNFDVYALKGIIKDYEKENNLKLEKVLTKNQYKELTNKLIVMLENAKMFFTTKTFKFGNEVNEEKICIPIQIPNVIEGKPFKYNLSMKRYNQLISPLLKEDSNENIIIPIKETLESISFEKNDIDYIFCVGGMTKYPKVFNCIADYFNQEPLRFTNIMESVSRGAAIYHYYDIKEIKENDNIILDDEKFTLIPKLPQTIFLNIKNGFPIPLIEANTEAGTPKVIEDIIEVNSESKLELELYTGMNIWDPKLKRLENVIIEFPIGVKLGSKISLKIEYTKKGLLTFDAWLKDEPDIKINLTLEGDKLSNKEIENINTEYSIEAVRGIIE